MAKNKQDQQPSANSSTSCSENSSASTSEDEKLTILRSSSSSSSRAATAYEKQRQARIAANNARMEALGLRNMANSLMGSPQIHGKKCSSSKSKRAVKSESDDDEYEPVEEGKGGCGSDSSTEDDGSDHEEMIISRRHRKSNSKKCQEKNMKSKSAKKVFARNPSDVPEFMDEDEALKRAIALSLKDSGEISDLHCGGSSQSSCIKQKRGDCVQVDNAKRKKRKPFTSRVQMTKDDLVIHFCQFDEVGKGSITCRDVERMAAAHDFLWTDKELSDMIRCFDSDRNGKLTLDDFRNVAERCNMLLKQEDS